MVREEALEQLLQVQARNPYDCKAIEYLADLHREPSRRSSGWAARFLQQGAKFYWWTDLSVLEDAFSKSCLCPLSPRDAIAAFQYFGLTKVDLPPNVSAWFQRLSAAVAQLETELETATEIPEAQPNNPCCRDARIAVCCPQCQGLGTTERLQRSVALLVEDRRYINDERILEELKGISLSLLRGTELDPAQTVSAVLEVLQSRAHHSDPEEEELEEFGHHRASESSGLTKVAASFSEEEMEQFRQRYQDIQEFQQRQEAAGEWALGIRQSALKEAGQA
eukprot:TRINITY_DN1116_c0_g1_i1.p1 TRINITY_DN1116_c0_g1~~TRINITY_DN1116_c0_g1_i1.p1  ORF type:complete len:279 (-),score=43.79 TRINITY_DN1116_c0_g1_i1:165-1001(-)